MQYKTAQRTLWHSAAYFIAPVTLVWKYIKVSVVMSTSNLFSCTPVICSDPVYQPLNLEEVAHFSLVPLARVNLVPSAMIKVI